MVPSSTDAEQTAADRSDRATVSGRSAAADRDRSITRRSLLRGAGAGGLALLAGCTADVGDEFPPNRQFAISELRPSLPVETRTDVMARRITAVAARSIESEEALVAAVDEYALSIRSIERERDVLTVESLNTDRADEGNLHDVAALAGGYAALIGAGYDAVAMAVTILDPAPASYGVAEVETEWAEGFNEGRFTAAEYGELVAGTVESKRHEPEVEVSPDE